MAQARQDQVAKVITKWLNGFVQTLDSDEAKADFLSVYNPEITWTDHAFHVRRQGHESVLGLKKAWNHCNQPFRTEIKTLHHTTSGAVVEVVWVGRCVNDIVRPDGTIVVKAHGKEFTNHVCFVLDIDEAGEIRRINEYYNRAFEDGVGDDSYVVIKGASMMDSKTADPAK